MEKTEKIEQARYSINVKVSAKRELYGEYTVKADTIEELESDLEKVGVLFLKQISNY